MIPRVRRYPRRPIVGRYSTCDLAADVYASLKAWNASMDARAATVVSVRIPPFTAATIEAITAPRPLPVSQGEPQ